MATTINVILADSTTAITVSTGARGPAGTSATNSVTSATASDGTAALYIDSLRFETTNGGPTQLGEMAWESTDGSIDAMLESGVIVAIGEDLVIRVRNGTNSPIAKGTALAYDGTTGASGKIEVKPWVGSNISTAKLFLGFAASAMDANGDGYSQWFGKLAGIDTDGGAENWQDEQIIYAVPSASSTLTNVAPTSGEYAVAAVVINAGSGTSGILYVRPSFEKFPVSADITDATSDGQTNPGKLLKTDAYGALQIEELTLGNSTVGTAGGLRVVGTNNAAAIFNDNDTSAALVFGSTSGTIMVGANNLSDLTSASTARTNLGAGTAGDAIFQATTYTGTGSARKLMGLDTDDVPAFGGVNVNSSSGYAVTGTNFLMSCGAGNRFLFRSGITTHWQIAAGGEWLSTTAGVAATYLTSSGTVTAAKMSQTTSTAADPTTTEYPTSGQWGIHKNTSTGNVFLAYNDGGSIKKVQLT